MLVRVKFQFPNIFKKKKKRRGEGKITTLRRVCEGRVFNTSEKNAHTKSCGTRGISSTLEWINRSKEGGGVDTAPEHFQDPRGTAPKGSDRVSFNT